MQQFNLEQIDVLRKLQPLDLHGCRAIHVQAARASFNRARVCLAALEWQVERQALFSLLNQETALWWCQRTYPQALEEIRLRLPIVAQPEPSGET